MRVLALGALWVPYIRDNWFDAIRHVLGENAVCVNAGPLIASKEKFAGQPEGYHSAYVYDLLRRDKFDYLFFYHDWIFGDYPDAFFEKIRLAGVKTMAFHPDDEPEHWYARNSKYDHHFDIVASHSTAGVKRRHANGWGDRAMYLPWGYNHRSCYAIPNSQKRYDVAFIGKHKVNDVQGKAHVEDGAQREQVLVRLAEACDSRGWTFRVFGFGWELHPQLKQYAGGVPSQEEMVRIYNETKVVFNPAWSSDGNPLAVQTKLRHFEVPGCGAFQITNENPELGQLFAPDEEIVFYSTDDDLLKKIEQYVSDDARREQIAAAGHARALREHTLDHRVQSLFRHGNSVYPARTPVATQPIRVKTLELRDRAALVELRRQLDQDESPLGDTEWVHFVSGSFLKATTDYAVLEPFFRSNPDEILAVGSYIDFAGLASNPLQPKLIESGSCVLAGDINVLDFNFPLLEEQGGCFTGFRREEFARLLVNYLTPRRRLRDLLDTFTTGTLESIHRLNAVPTGRIVTEILLHVPEGNPHRIGMRNAEYARRLQTLLPRFAALHWRIVVYGISGMGEVTMELVGNTPGLELQAIVDRSLKVSSFNGTPVVTAAQLAELRPDVIILTASASGASIYSSIAHLEASTCILPLYDLNHPVWSVVYG